MSDSGTASIAVPAIAREPRIDILRGFAILTIVLNHLTQVVEDAGLSGGMIPTPTRFGYSTAAELFVILSGYMVGLVYLSRPLPGRAVVRRAATLWLYDVGLFAIVVPLVVLMNVAERRFWGFDGFFANPAVALLRFVTLQKAPRLLDILQLYILLMLVAPAAIAIHRRSPMFMIALSIGLYLAAQWLIIRHLAEVPTGSDDGALKLLSWQLLFFVPMALGAMRFHVTLFRWLDGNRTMLALLGALFAAAAVAKTMGSVEPPVWLTPRYGLHVLRLGHAVLTILLYASILACAGRALDWAPIRAVGVVGRYSLDCFAVGVVATYLFGLLWPRIDGGHLAYYLMALAAIVATVIAARLRGMSQRDAI